MARGPSGRGAPEAALRVVPATGQTGAVTVLFSTHPRFVDHDTGRLHPERPARLDAVIAGFDAAASQVDVIRAEPSPASLDAVRRVHAPELVQALRDHCDAGGGPIDADTVACAVSFEAALLAAGAGLDAIEALDQGAANAAFLAVRPPGHHATPTRAMGFCLLNNVAIAAAALADRGERVMIVDYDAHHGNGTQDAFFDDDRVCYVSLHQWPLYPGTGALDENGRGRGSGSTVNIPLPSGSTGEHYLRAIDEIIVPASERFRPSWLLLSAGFDAHRADPLTSLGLSAGDFGLIASRLAALVPPGRRIVFLEGGYDLGAIAKGVEATLVALDADADAGQRWSEEPTSGGPGAAEVTAAIAVHGG